MKAPLDRELDKVYEAFSRDHKRLREELMSSLPERSKSPEQLKAKQFVGFTITKSRTARIAAAAVIIMAVGFITFLLNQNKQKKTIEVAQGKRCPADLTTFASLTFAYRQGGMEMVEKICDKALTMAGPRPANISIQDLLEESNGKNLERTEL